MHVIFRADGSTAIGIGHIMRCLALALGLRERGFGATFLTSPGAPAVDLIRSHGLEALIVSATGPAGEATQTIELGAHRAATVVVTDLCYAAALNRGSYIAEYHGLIHKQFFTVAIVGSDVCDLAADVVVSPYVRSVSGRASRADRTYLDGPAYAVLRPEFRSVLGSRRDIVEHPQRVLITMGGGDEHGLTIRALAALALLRDEDLETHVIVGPAYPPAVAAGARAVADKLAGPCLFLPHDANLADQMLWADIAIIGDGLTKYETAAIGTPSVILTSADSDTEVNAQFGGAGTAVLVSRANERMPLEIADEIRSLLDDAQARARMSRNGRALVDGRAVDRLSALISDAARRRTLRLVPG